MISHIYTFYLCKYITNPQHAHFRVKKSIVKQHNARFVRFYGMQIQQAQKFEARISAQTIVFVGRNGQILSMYQYLLYLNK